MDLTGENLARLNANPLYRALGIRIVAAADGRAESRLTAPDALCWPVEGSPHGGIVFTQVDTTMATAVMSVLAGDEGCSTIGADIQYTSPARGAYLVCNAWCTHRTGRMAFVRTETRSEAGALVALGQGTFRIFAAKEGSVIFRQ